MTPDVRIFRSIPAVALVALCLAGCSKPAGPANEAEGDAQANIAAVAPPVAVEAADGFGGATIGGDGSPILLAGLSPEDVGNARLAGELGCGFTTANDKVALIAKGNVDTKEPSQGIIRVADTVETVSAPDGFDAMVKGVTFSGKGKTIEIELTGPATATGESPSRPAKLVYDRADGAKRTISGNWTCGP